MIHRQKTACTKSNNPVKNKIKFSKIHVFPYSRRKGTPADLMDNQIDEKVKKERVSKIINLSKELEHNYFSKFIISRIYLSPIYF